MKRSDIYAFIIVIGLLLPLSEILSLEPTSKKYLSKLTGAYNTGMYKNLLTELLGKSEAQVKTKIVSAYNQFFYGNNDTQRVYYPVEPDMAYIKDTLHDDVRSEGMSYGMMITVQMDKKEEFDRLWKWAKTYMQHTSGPRKNY
ncbi:MAG: glycosyl hydrolase family 8, partial [bacterium]